MSDEVRVLIAKALSARDYVNGPPLWDDEQIERRWGELDPDMQTHYAWMAMGVMETLAKSGRTLA